MTQNEDASTELLLVRARRAYELGRLKAQARWLVALLPLSAIALHFSGKPVATALNSLLLAAAMVYLGWRGTDLGRAVLPGFLGGTLAFCLPLIACSTGVCSRTPSPRLIFLCGLAGLIAGLWLTFRALAADSMNLRGVAAAGLVAGLTASLSCTVAGVSGILGMLVGLVAASSPALALARLRSS